MFLTELVSWVVVELNLYCVEHVGNDYFDWPHFLFVVFGISFDDFLFEFDFVAFHPESFGDFAVAIEVVDFVDSLILLLVLQRQHSIPRYILELNLQFGMPIA